MYLQILPMRHGYKDGKDDEMMVLERKYERVYVWWSRSRTRLVEAKLVAIAWRADGG